MISCPGLPGIEVLTAIDLAEDMIRELQAFNIKDKRTFSVWITMKNRPN